MKSGYGKITLAEQKTGLTHRVVFEAFVRPLKEGEWVLHSCDNPACCNPSHLFIGTPRDNTQDSLKKGRHGTQQEHWQKKMRCENNPGAKLANSDVAQMRKLWRERVMTQAELARNFGVHQSVVSRIVRNLTWRYLPC